MMCRRSTVAGAALLTACLYGGQANAEACEGSGPRGPYAWRSGPAGAEYIERATWAFPCAKESTSIIEKEVSFTAFRFDRRKFEFSLVHPPSEIESIDSKSHRGGVFFNSRRQARRYGQNIATVGSLSSGAKDYFIVTTAGWWLSNDSPEPNGYLKINDDVINSTFGRGQSSIVCLDDKTVDLAIDRGHIIASWYYYPRGDFSIAAWKQKKEPEKWSKWERLQRCENVFQTGPRIVEGTEGQRQILADKTIASIPDIGCLAKEQDRKAGICDHLNTEKKLLPSRRQRVVLAADTQFRSPGRRHYLIFFHTETSFYQIQHILLDRRFYGEGAGPGWAVNLAGGERAGLLAKFGAHQFELGNVESDLPSLIVVRRSRTD